MPNVVRPLSAPLSWCPEFYSAAARGGGRGPARPPHASVGTSRSLGGRITPQQADTAGCTLWHLGVDPPGFLPPTRPHPPGPSVAAFFMPFVGELKHFFPGKFLLNILVNVFHYLSPHFSFFPIFHHITLYHLHTGWGESRFTVVSMKNSLFLYNHLLMIALFSIQTTMNRLLPHPACSQFRRSLCHPHQLLE